MIPVYTQKSLDTLTWNQVQKLHKSLGLKAGAGARTRRHLQQNIVAAMPRPVAEPEVIATPLTCAQCPFARLIEDNRYCCQVSQTASDVVRGHWEGTSDCYQAVADVQPKTIATAFPPIAPEPIAPEEIAVIQPKISLAERMTGLTRHPFRYEWDVDQGRHSFSASCFGLCECSCCERERELPLNEQRRGSHQIMLKRLSQVKAPTPAIQQLQNQMDEPKQDITRKSTLSLFKIEAFDPSILPIEPEQLSEEIEVKPECTIHWTQALLTGVITGKKGAKRTFYIRNGEIFIMLSPDFTAGESKHPNVRHTQIRDAINAGRDFDPKAFKDSPQFLTDTKNYGGIGRIMQGADGRWWAWSQTGVTGHSFLCQSLACKYLDRVATQAQKQLVCAN